MPTCREGSGSRLVCWLSGGQDEDGVADDDGGQDEDGVAGDDGGQEDPVESRPRTLLLSHLVLLVLSSASYVCCSERVDEICPCSGLCVGSTLVLSTGVGSLCQAYIGCSVKADVPPHPISHYARFPAFSSPRL